MMRDAARKFRLREQERVSDGLTRVALGQLEMAIEQLDGGSTEDAGEAVHEARKSLKRARAVVRLARGELGNEIYRRENVTLREAGRLLAGARDSKVLLETLDAVNRPHPDLAPSPILRETFATEHVIAEQQLQNEGVAGEVVRQLQDVRERVSDWSLNESDAQRAIRGLTRIYRRARRAYRHARRKPRPENLHELRKRTKDLRYCAQILRPISNKPLKRLARDANELSDLIGEHHDLAFLAERVQERRDQFDDPATRELGELISDRQEELLHEALPLGRRIFRKKPRKLARTLERPTAAR
jgi:CHAD domain-containing protein